MTASECSFELYFKIPIMALLGITCLGALVGNLLVCLAVSISKDLQTPANVFITSLSISDIIISLTLPPMEMTYVYCYPNWPLGSIGTTIENAFWMFSLAMPFVTVTVITIDRFKAVTSLQRYREVITRKKIIAALVFIWVYAFIAVFIMAWNFSEAPNDKYVWNVKEIFYYPFLALHIVIPMFIILFLYGNIIKSAKATRRQVVHASTSARVEMKLAKTVGIIISVLFLVWLPVLGLEVVYAFDSSSCTVEQLGVVSLWIICLNGIVNPAVYCYRNRDFRKTIVSILKWNCKDNQWKYFNLDQGYHYDTFQSISDSGRSY